MTFVFGVLVLALAAPALARLVRGRLPAARRRPAPVAPVAFGDSPKARRSPRHAVLLHRGLAGTFFGLVVALAILPAATALADTGVAIMPALFAFVVPSLLVGLHVRRRSLDS